MIVSHLAEVAEYATLRCGVLRVEFSRHKKNYIRLVSSHPHAGWPSYRAPHRTIVSRQHAPILGGVR